MEKDLCRICGKSRNATNLLKITSEISFQIEHYCRIQLMDNKLLPQKICFDCKYSIGNFAKFSQDAEAFQSRLMLEHNIHQVKIEAADLPIVDYVAEDLQAELIESTATLKRSLEETNVSIVRKKKARAEQPSPAAEEEPEPSKDCVNDDCDNSASEWNNSNDSSDSDYQSSSYKKAKNSKPSRSPKGWSRKGRATRRAKTATATSRNEVIELDVADTDKNDDGTVSNRTDTNYSDKWTDMRLPCQECGQVVVGPYDLKVHYTACHSPDLNGYEKYPCDDCCEVLDGFHKFLNHVTATHQSSFKFCCLVCSDMFWNFDALHKHYQTKHEDECSSIFFCLLCGRFFKTSYYLSTHETRFHKKQELPDDGGALQNQTIHTVDSLFAEEIISETFSHDTAFNIPKPDKNPDGSVSKECQMRYASKNWASQPMNCTECSIQLASTFQLSLHIDEEHPGAKSRNFVCTNCPEHKTFFNLESYVNHSFTIHHPHLKYFCYICDEICWNYKALYHHFKTAHGDQRVNICLYCGKYHKSGYDLKCHKEVHKTRNERAEGIETINCDVCSKAVHRKHFQRHMDTHKSEKTWICETCGTSFASKSTLINHYLGKQSKAQIFGASTRTHRFSISLQFIKPRSLAFAVGNNNIFYADSVMNFIVNFRCLRRGFQEQV